MGSETLELAPGSPKFFVLFAYTSNGEETIIYRWNIVDLVNMAKQSPPDVKVDFIVDEDDDDSKKPLVIPLIHFHCSSLEVLGSEII